MSRLTAPDRDALSADARTIWDRIAATRSGGVMRGPSSVMMHVPELAGRVMEVEDFFRTDAELPAVDRELVILRTGMRCNSSYELAQHVRIAHAMGMSDAELGQVRDGPDAPGLAAFDAHLLRAVDELHDRQQLTRTTWDELARSYTERQLLDLVFTWASTR